MASTLSIAMTKQDALDRINAQLVRLSEAEGREYTPLPTQGRDAMVLVRDQFAHIADTLDALYGAPAQPSADDASPADTRTEAQKQLDALKPTRKGGR